MLLSEAKQILKQNNYVLMEGSYKDIIHSKLKDIRMNQIKDNDEEAASKKLSNKITKKIYAELSEFCSDFNDEIVDNAISLTKISNSSNDDTAFEFTINNDNDGEELHFKILSWKDTVTIFINIVDRGYKYKLINSEFKAKESKEKISEILDKVMNYITSHWN